MGRAIETEGLEERLASVRAPAVGRRGRAVPELRQLHDGLSDLLLRHGGGCHRPRRPSPSGARLGLLLHHGVLLPPRRQRPGLDPVPATASGSRTSSRRGSTSSARRAASVAGAASPGVRLGIDITAEATAVLRGPAGGDDREDPELETILAEHPFFRDLRPAHLDMVVGCAANVRSSRASSSSARVTRPAASTSSARERSRWRSSCPGGADHDRELEAGDVLGWSWLFPPYQRTSTRGRSPRARAGLRRRLPARQVRGGYGPRLRVHEPLRPASWSSARGHADAAAGSVRRDDGE